MSEVAILGEMENFLKGSQCLHGVCKMTASPVASCARRARLLFSTALCAAVIREQSYPVFPWR